MKEKKKGKVLPVILLLISIACIGVGGYLFYADNNKTVDTKNIESDSSEQDSLDINSEEAKKMFDILQLDNISNEHTGDLKDFYYNNDLINDDLRLFLAFYAMDEVKEFASSGEEELVITKDALNEKVLSIFENPVEDGSYKTINLAGGLVANWDGNQYKITKTEVEDSKYSRYYGELVEILKFDNQALLTVNSYYADYEENDVDGGVYYIYKDSNKSTKFSNQGFDNLPKISELGVTGENFVQYKFIFNYVDGEYKLNSYVRI